jgi:hypothetical protein
MKDLSFIPYSIRKAHGLTTIDNKVAIYSYYFHRLLQRAGDITIYQSDIIVTILQTCRSCELQGCALFENLEGYFLATYHYFSNCTEILALMDSGLSTSRNW